MNPVRLRFVVPLLAAGVAWAAPNPALQPVPEDPALPRVLLIGDSISIAYTLPVRERLAGIANVQRIPTNGGPTAKGLAELDVWLTTGGKSAQDWDVIHFNWGLHDLCYRLPGQPATRDKIQGQVSATVEQYAAQLDTLVARLRKTGARLVFATTTPVPEGEAGRVVGDDLRYNAAAREVMARHGVAINDLHAVMAGRMGELAVGPGNVHFSEAGSARLADQVAAAVRAALDPEGFVPLFEGPGGGLHAWTADEDGGWLVADDGSLTCAMKEVPGKDGQPRRAGRGYLWTRQAYEDFELTLGYKLSPAANSGVFFRTDPANPVQGGFEIQLMDDAGFRQTHPGIGPRQLNGALYDATVPAPHPAKAPGEWQTFRLVCRGPRVRAEINGVTTVDVDLSAWTTAGRNPDGTPNKFTTALGHLPRTGRIGFQNHGDVVWFRDVKIRRL
jgi:acyl-CoA thioesterase-1